jgi:hypothetical protein
VTPGGTEVKCDTAAVNLLGDNINTVKKKSKALIDACKEVDLEVNTRKSLYMFVSCHPNAGKAIT